MNLAGKNIKCIAFDLDHTVINSDGTMSDATRNSDRAGYCRRDRRNSTGERSCVCDMSGKHRLQIKGISYAVTSNGAAIYNKRTGERIHGVAIEYADLHSILDAFAHYFHNGQITY